jgi:hypothetical protein
MKRMITWILIALAGLAFCGLMLGRHAYRPAPLLGDDERTPVRPATQMDRWQSGIQVDTRTEYRPASTEELMAKLRAEERRQRPEEGRN